MRQIAITALGSEYQEQFSVLQGAGFALTVTAFAPESFGNFAVLCSKDGIEFKAINDRGQVFIELRMSDGEWCDKEEILEDVGVSRARYETVDGLWTGFEPNNQATDLKEHLSVLIEAASNDAA